MSGLSYLPVVECKIMSGLTYLSDNTSCETYSRLRSATIAVKSSKYL